MSIVQDIKKQIAHLYESLAEIQASCSHPPPAVSKVGKSNTGNYDPSADRYWYEIHCQLCDKQWTEDQ